MLGVKHAIRYSVGNFMLLNLLEADCGVYGYYNKLQQYL